MPNTFKTGDTITWCEESFIVIDNFGESGRVKQGSTIIDNFKWTFMGETARLVKEVNHAEGD